MTVECMTNATATVTSPAGMPPAGWRLVRQSAAVLLFALAGWQLWDYPIYRGFLLAGLVVYGAALVRWPLIWLAVLPAMVPGLELRALERAAFLEDIDILFLFTLACLAWRGPAAPAAGLHRWPLKIDIALVLLVVSYSASLIVG